MSQSLSVWSVLLAALVAANLPFMTERIFGLWSPKRTKTLSVRLLELVALYFVVGGFGLALERHVGQIAAQRWEFYAVTAALFVTFAFPGFVRRYLMRGRK